MKPDRIIVAITGASGVIYGIRALELLRAAKVETHLIVSKAAELTIAYETDVPPKKIRDMASVYHAAGDVGAAISSGSSITMGMMICPCSIRTMSEIATGVTSSLVSRAADVVLKERRKLVLAIPRNSSGFELRARARALPRLQPTIGKAEIAGLAQSAPHPVRSF